MAIKNLGSVYIVTGHGRVENIDTSWKEGAYSRSTDARRRARELNESITKLANFVDSASPEELKEMQRAIATRPNGDPNLSLYNKHFRAFYTVSKVKLKAYEDQPNE